MQAYWTFAICVAVFTVAFTLAVMLGRIEDSIDRLGAEIGGTRVPAVSCAEDEAIWWRGVDTLGCVHFEEVR